MRIDTHQLNGIRLGPWISYLGVPFFFLPVWSVNETFHLFNRTSSSMNCLFISFDVPLVWACCENKYVPAVSFVRGRYKYPFHNDLFIHQHAAVSINKIWASFGAVFPPHTWNRSVKWEFSSKEEHFKSFEREKKSNSKVKGKNLILNCIKNNIKTSNELHHLCISTDYLFPLASWFSSTTFFFSRSPFSRIHANKLYA